MSESNPKVSVLIVTYNHQRYIEQAVRSALAQQTDFPFEIVIGEDHSTDRTLEVCHALADARPDVIRLVEQPENLGPARNFAQTYTECRGQYVALLEGDDFWIDPAKLAKQAAAMDANPEWSMCFHRTKFVDADGTPTGTISPPSAWDATPSLESLLFQNFVSTQSVMYRRGVVPTWPEDYLQFPNGDWLIAILHAASGGVGFLPEVMSCYRQHASGVWSSKSDEERLAAIVASCTRLERILGPRYHSTLAAARLHFVSQAMAQAKAHGAALDHELSLLRNSWSYKIGRWCTWPLSLVGSILQVPFRNQRSRPEPCEPAGVCDSASKC